MGAGHRFHRFSKRGVKAKTFVEVHDVVIDGLGNPDHRFLAASTTDFRVNLLASPQRSIPSDDEQQIYAEFLQMIHHFNGILRTTGTAKDSSTEGVNRRNGFGSQR